MGLTDEASFQINVVGGLVLLTTLRRVTKFHSESSGSTPISDSFGLSSKSPSTESSANSSTTYPKPYVPPISSSTPSTGTQQSTEGLHRLESDVTLVRRQLPRSAIADSRQLLIRFRCSSSSPSLLSFSSPSPYMYGLRSVCKRFTHLGRCESTFSFDSSQVDGDHLERSSRRSESSGFTLRYSRRRS